jgi:hypothetical protein
LRSSVVVGAEMADDVVGDREAGVTKLLDGLTKEIGF